jgi:hypothetical protein
MAITAFSGPVISYGQNTIGSNPSTTDYNPDLGPSLFWGGVGRIDPRPNFNYIPGQAAGQFTAGFGTSDVQTISYAPYALSTSAIAAAANVVSGTAMTLVSTNSTSTGVSVSNSCTNYNTGATVTGLLMVDGFASFTGVIANSILTVSSLTGTISIGMTISGTGVNTGTTIVNQLTGAPGGVGTYTVQGDDTTSSTTITAQATGTTALAQPFGLLGQPSSVYLWNPQALVARAVNVTGSASATGGNITISGYDIYGVPMSEVIAAPASATTVNGKKAFKYISSVVPAFTDAHNYSVGTTDIYGFPLRSDFFSDVAINYNAAAITANTGYVAAVTTSPATTTTGDVRGTYALQSASDASKRLAIRQFILPANMNSTTGLFGVTQA